MTDECAADLKEIRAHRGNESSTLAAINVTKCFIGAASFELPWAFAQAGVLGSLLGLLGLALLSSFSLTRLAACSELVQAQRTLLREQLLTADIKYHAPTLPEVGYAAFGTAGKWVTWFGVVVFTLFGCGSYLVFISSTMAELVPTLNATEWLLVALPLMTCLSWLRDIRKLALTSSFGIVALLVAVLVATIDAAQHGSSTWIPANITATIETQTLVPVGSSRLPLFKLDTFPLFLGNAGYLYLIGTAILPLAQSMTEPRRFSSALNPSIVIVTVLNLAFGLFAYIQYGGPEGRVCDSNDIRTGSGLGCVQDNVLKNLTPGLSTHLVKTFLVIDITFTCIVFLFPINEAIEQETFGSAVSPVVTTRPRLAHWFTLDIWRRNLSRAVITCSIGAVAYCVPHFSLLTGLTGGFGNNILGFILPPVFYYKLRVHEGYWKQPRSYARLAEVAGIVVTVTFGIFFLFLTLIVFGKQIVNH